MEDKVWDDLNDLEDEESFGKVYNNLPSIYSELKDKGFKFTSALKKGPAYIMNDGMLLYIDDNRDILELPSDAFSSHPQLDVYCLENGLVPEDALINRVLCETDNAIRINDGSNLASEVVVGLPKKSPTEEQYRALEDWLYTLMSYRKKVIVGDERTTNVFKEYDFSSYMPEDIIKKIKIYYNNGQLRELKEILELENEE